LSAITRGGLSPLIFKISAARVKSSGVALVTDLADEALVKQTGCLVSASKQKNDPDSPSKKVENLVDPVITG